MKWHSSQPAVKTQSTQNSNVNDHPLINSLPINNSAVIIIDSCLHYQSIRSTAFLNHIGSLSHKHQPDQHGINHHRLSHTGPCRKESKTHIDLATLIPSRTFQVRYMRATLLTQYLFRRMAIKHRSSTRTSSQSPNKRL